MWLCCFRVGFNDLCALIILVLSILSKYPWKIRNCEDNSGQFFRTTSISLKTPLFCAVAPLSKCSLVVEVKCLADQNLCPNTFNVNCLEPDESRLLLGAKNLPCAWETTSKDEDINAPFLWFEKGGHSCCRKHGPNPDFKKCVEFHCRTSGVSGQKILTPRTSQGRSHETRF